jgi:hypothetical protein
MVEDYSTDWNFDTCFQLIRFWLIGKVEVLGFDLFPTNPILVNR